jgi:hypothetical protein
VGGLLARQLCHAACSELTTLVGAKNNQLAGCVVQLNEALGGPCPTPDGWLHDLGNRAKEAWDFPDGTGLPLTADDLANLNRLWQWLAGPRLAPLRLSVRDALGPCLDAPFAPEVVPEHRLAELVAVLNDLIRRIPTRGLPDDWAYRGPVADLFAYPVYPYPGGPALDFVGWARTMDWLAGISPVR